MRALLAIGFLALCAGEAWACPMCITGNRNQMAFLGTTILLSLLPLGMVGGGLLWLRHRARAIASEGEGS